MLEAYNQYLYANIGSDSSRRIWKFNAVRFQKAIKTVNTLHTHYIIIN